MSQYVSASLSLDATKLLLVRSFPLLTSQVNRGGKCKIVIKEKMRACFHGIRWGGEIKQEGRGGEEKREGRESGEGRKEGGRESE